MVTPQKSVSKFGISNPCLSFSIFPAMLLPEHNRLLIYATKYLEALQSSFCLQ